jgi:hypothetical protein
VLGSPAYHEPATHRVISSACRALRASKAYEAYSAGPALLQTPPDRSPNLVQSPPSAGRAHAFPLPPLALTLAAAAWLLSNGLVRSAGLLDAAAFSLIWRRSPARAGRTGTHSSGAVRRPHSRCPMEPLPTSQGRERHPASSQRHALVRLARSYHAEPEVPSVWCGSGPRGAPARTGRRSRAGLVMHELPSREAAGSHAHGP